MPQHVDIDRSAAATREPGLPRRAVLTAGLVGAAAAGALPGLVAAAAAAPAPGANAALVATALDCAGTGELCLQHCYAEFAKGETMLAVCAQRVAEMVPVCKTLASLASLQSKHLPAYAKVCIDVCADCETECRKHEKHAAICKACADECVKVIDALKKMAA